MYISQPWVYGNSYFSNLVIVVTPDFETLGAWAKAKGWDASDKKALAVRPEVKALLLEEVKKEAKASKLKSFEVPKDLHVEGEVNELAQARAGRIRTVAPDAELKLRAALMRSGASTAFKLHSR